MLLGDRNNGRIDDDDNDDGDDDDDLTTDRHNSNICDWPKKCGL